MGGRERRVDADDKPQPKPEYDQMDVEHQVEDDAEVEEDVGDVEEDVDDGQQQRRRRGKRVSEPDLEPLDDYPGGSHDTTLPMRYHVHVVRKAVDGEIPINVIL
jgi:hypothetical protein